MFLVKILLGEGQIQKALLLLKDTITLVKKESKENIDPENRLRLMGMILSFFQLPDLGNDKYKRFADLPQKLKEIEALLRKEELEEAILKIDRLLKYAPPALKREAPAEKGKNS